MIDMKFIIRILMSVLLIATLVNKAEATHNRAGEITYVQTGPLTILMTVTTYTKTSSVQADRDSIEIFWGDGTNEFVQRFGDRAVPPTVSRSRRGP